MTDLLAEVDDLMRRERMEAIWREHRIKFIAAIAAVIFCTGAWSLYNTWNNNAKMRDTDALIVLMQNKNFPDNIKPEELDMRSNMETITNLVAARTFLMQKENDKALALYKEVGEDRGADSEIRQLGTLMTVTLSAGKAGTKPDDLLAQLDDIYKDGSSPWRYHARLEAATILAARQDYKKAEDLLAPVLEEKNLPQTLAGKARALHHIYSLKAQQNSKAGEKS